MMLADYDFFLLEENSASFLGLLPGEECQHSVDADSDKPYGYEC